MLRAQVLPTRLIAARPFAVAAHFLVAEMTLQRRIRVVYCLDTFEIGGTELNAVRTAESLDSSRFELSVIYLGDRGPLRSRYERMGIRMTHVPIARLYSPRTVAQGWRLASFLQSWKTDILHSHDIYTNIFSVPWARLRGGCATIASRRWMHEAPRPELMTANRWASMCADRILANSKGVAEYLALNERVRQDKIVEIPNFLDADAFVLADESARLAQRRAWGVPDGAFVIGIVARLSPVKNHSLLISAAAHLERRIHLVLVGDGPSRAALEKLAQQMGLADRVHFAGEVVSRENLHQYFDVSVLCSTSEGFPNSVLEAMAAARPVIATPVGGVTEAITDGSTGILVSVNDLEGLVHALRRLQSDTHLRAKLGDAAREFVRIKYHRSTVIEALSSLYERLAYRTSFQSSGAA